MKKTAIFTKLLLCLFSFGAFAQSQIHLSTLKTERTESAQEIEQYSEDQFYILRFNKIPNDREKAKLAESGIELLTYIPDQAYYVKITAGNRISKEQLGALNILETVKLKPELKIANNLKDTSNLPTWIQHGQKIHVTVHFYDNYRSPSYGELKGKAEVLSVNRRLNSATLSIKKKDLIEIASIKSIRYIEPTTRPFDVEEVDAMTNQRSNFLKTGGLDFDGTGVAVHIGDGGTVSDHLDYAGRLSLTSSVNESSHATHVCGIVGGAGNFDPMVQGQAPGATLYSHSGSGVLFNNSVLNNAINNGVVITTHSLGWGCNDGYNGSARSADQDIVDFPSLIHVFSAGNSGADNCNQYPTGWGNITGGYKQGKNVFAVANLSNTDGLAGSSSRGPASDGRIKPDIGAVGSSVYNTQAGNTYGTKSGTSMAAPAVAGVLAQLYQAHRSLNGGEDPDAALIRALTLNTAEDLGNVGPDFKYGWGKINARKAYELMANNQYISGAVSNSGNVTHNIAVPNGTDRVNIMVYWTDPAGPSGATKALINDIDMTVSNGGITELPFVLSVSESNEAILNAPATKGIDHLNNMEQVVIDNPANNLTVNLFGYSIATGTQSYYITYEFVNDDITVTFPNGKDKLSTDENYTIRWDAFGDIGTFDIEFSADSGATWNTVATGISGSDRYLTGWSPSTTTNQGLIKITRGTQSDLSDKVFTSIGVPQNPSFEWSCIDKALLSWDPVPNATGYTIYQMGTKYMEPVGTSKGASYIVSIPTNTSDFFAIAANFNDSAGMRTIAFTKNAGAFGTCPNGPDLTVSQILHPLAQGCLEGGTPLDVVVMYSNEGTSTINSFTATYDFNGGNIVTQTINTPLLPGKSIEVTFNTNVTLPNNGQPILNVSGTVSGDVQANNNSKQLTVNMDQASFGLPLIENFDNQSTCATTTNCEATVCTLNGWLENVSNDDIDWRVDRSGTPSANTGPSDDRTGGENYIYLEGSECFGKVAQLKSGCIELIAGANLSFYYNMNGSDMGNLAVEIYEPAISSTTTVWSISGNQGNNWRKVDVDLTAYAGKTIQIIFKGTTGSSWETDMAIDDILIESVDLTDLAISTSSNSIITCDTLIVSGDGPISNTTYNWNFGGNAVPSTATGKGPHKVHYNSVGTKTISLNGDGGLSEVATITVSETTIEPSISINPLSIPTCTAGQFDFNATGTYLGSGPTYEWFLNGSAVGSNNANFSVFNPTNGDVIDIIATSSANCLLEDTARAKYTINQTEGIPHKFYISSSSMNPSGAWQITNSSSVVVQNNSSYTTNRAFEEQEFCLIDDCYDFTFTSAFKAGSCNEPAWFSQAYPTAGTRVSHNGNIFESKWYVNAGDEPDPTVSGGATPWQYIGPCQQTISTDVFGIKTADNTVTHFEITVQNYDSPYTENFCLGTITSSKTISEHMINIYPNPTSGLVNIETSNTGVSYHVFDLNGRILMDGLLNNSLTIIDLGGLKPGVYFIKVNSENKTVTERIIKK